MKEKLRVAMFGHKRLSREGGIEIVVKELCIRMARDGCQVTCYNRSGHHVSGAEYDKKIDIRAFARNRFRLLKKRDWQQLVLLFLRHFTLHWENMTWYIFMQKAPHFLHGCRNYSEKESLLLFTALTGSEKNGNRGLEQNSSGKVKGMPSSMQMKLLC